MRSSGPCFALAVNRGTISSSFNSASPRKTWPVALIDTVIGLASTLSGPALLCGKSSGTPAVIMGAVTMKMTRSTSMTSMNGVMLISLMALLRRPRRRRRSAAVPWANPPDAIAMTLLPLSREPDALVDLARQDGRELVREGFEARLYLGDLGLELVVGEHRRDRGEQADGGGEQRLGDAGRHDREACVLRGGDRGERGHDAPHRAEEADVGTRRTDGGQEEEARFEPLDLTLDGDVEHLVDALREAGDLPARPLEGALPLTHGGDENRCEPRGRRLGQRPIKLLQRAPRPERLLEGVHLALGAGEQQRLVDDDGPAPHRGGEQADHHQLHDRVGAPEQTPERHVVRDLRALRGVGRIHAWSSCFEPPVRPTGPSRIPLARPCASVVAPESVQNEGGAAWPGDPEPCTRLRGDRVNCPLARPSALLFQNGAKRVRDTRRTPACDSGDMHVCGHDDFVA